MLAVLWHGRGPREGHALLPLAEVLTANGAAVAVPDWDSTSKDGGSELLGGSLICAARRGGGRPLVVVGWSLGGTAALSLALAPRQGQGPSAVVGLAADVRSASPLNGLVPLDCAQQGSSFPGTPMVLVHGVADHVVPPDATRGFVGLARTHGWPVDHREVETDHAGAIGMQYDTGSGACVPSEAPWARTGRAAAVWAVEAALRLATPGIEPPSPTIRERFADEACSG